MFVTNRSYGTSFTSEEALTLFKSIETELQHMTMTLSSESKEMIHSKLSGLFGLFQKCVAAIEASSNPIAKRKCASSLSSIQANYILVAESLRSKCYSIGVMLLGHYPCVSDESLAIVRKGFSEDISHGAKLAALAKEAATLKA